MMIVIARIISYGSKIPEDPYEIKKQVRKGKVCSCGFYVEPGIGWTDGLTIGIKAFLKEVGCQFYDRKRVLKKQMISGTDQAGKVLHCDRRLRLFDT